MAYRGCALGALVLACVGAAGCSYTSEYVPPADGRARAVWQDDKAVVMAPAELPECVTKEKPPEGYTYTVPRDGDGYYHAPHGHTHVHVGIIIIGPPPPILFPVAPGMPNLGGEGGKYLAVALAVGAIVAFPFLALGLAMGHPEPEEEVAAAINQVNSFNDKSRERMEACAAWYEEMRRGGGP